MRCEKPWSASVGATKKTRARASVTSTSDDAASPGSDIRYERLTPPSLLGDHILEGGPADEREDEVVEAEECEIASRRGDDARTDPSDHQWDREREEQERHQQVAGARRNRHRADERADRADPEVCEHDAGDGRCAQAVEEQGEDRQRDDLCSDEEGERRDRLREPDRTSVARREHEAVEHVLFAFWNERAPEAQKRGEHDRDPEKAARRKLRRAGGQREVEDDEGRDHEEQHCRQRVACAQLEQEILPRERPDVGEIVHAARGMVIVARCSTWAGSCVATTNVRSPRSSSSCASSSAT